LDNIGLIEIEKERRKKKEEKVKENWKEDR
jgi:hypothetical protein